MHPRAENDAMVDLENSIKEMKNALGNRNVPDEDLKNIHIDMNQCNYGHAICRCMEHIRNGFKEEMELILLLSSACAALLIYHDLRYDRATEEYRRGIARGLWPTWYADFKARRLEHHRKVVKHCLKWSRCAENVRFNLILKHDNLARKQKKAALEPTQNEETSKLAENQDPNQEKKNDATPQDECQYSGQEQDTAAHVEHIIPHKRQNSLQGEKTEATPESLQISVYKSP